MVWAEKSVSLEEYRSGLIFNKELNTMDYCLHARGIIRQAYKDGQITAKTRDNALDRVHTVMNGTWMFEQGK